MIKLYKRIDGVLHYWETWEEPSGNSATVHWGKVGERGEEKLVPLTKRKPLLAMAREALADLEGYTPLSLEHHRRLLIEYAVDGFGAEADLTKRSDLQNKMDQTLGWTGLGHCDGGSIGSGTMEVCCFVVDFDIAQKVIGADLKGTEFENFIRIYDEDSEYSARP